MTACCEEGTFRYCGMMTNSVFIFSRREEDLQCSRGCCNQRSHLVEELLLCIDEQVLLFGCSSSGWDRLGGLFTRLADHQTIVTLATGLVCPLGFGHLIP